MSGTVSGPATGVNSNIVEDANLHTDRSAGAGANLSPSAPAANAAGGLNALSGDKPLSKVYSVVGTHPREGKMAFTVQFMQKVAPPRAGETYARVHSSVIGNHGMSLSNYEKFCLKYQIVDPPRFRAGQS
ncbi:MAG: hypothetical protein LBQ51_00885 [Desulfovibrio sp.]|jgi:hypothetical protein|nr:hypothetical protein [Desulfovibrio sp.]